MYAIKLAFRSLFLKSQLTITRILSLAAGLAFGILLLAEVFYYTSFDSFYPDANRIYNVQSEFKMDRQSDKFETYGRVSGAIAPGMKANVAGIEAATRFNSIGSHVFYTEDKKSYEANVSLADEHLFEVLPRPMITGDPAEILKRPMTCMISSELAEEMGGNVIGVQIEAKQYPGKKLSISGVFETLPENSNYKYDILVSMVSIKEFAWDGSNNWLGNDRYCAFVKLLPGVDPKSLAPSIRKMQEKHQDIIKIELEQGGVFLKYSLIPIQKIHTSKTMDMIIILATIAIAVLFVSLMNYVLLTLSTLINRSKTSAIHKTCGAQSSNMYQLIFSETFLLFLISVMVALSILIMGKPFVESQLNHSFKAILNPYVIWPVLAILSILIVFTSYLPGRFFSRIPVSSAFRNYKQKRNKWKLALLSFQFIGASFILTIMIIASLQYNNMKSADHGYQTKGIYYGSTTGMSASKVSVVLNELRKLPEIEKVGLGCEVPVDGASGNNIMSPDGKRDLFNVADFYEVDENYLSILNIPVTHGKAFSPQTASVNDVLISQKGADLLKLNNKWNEVIGKDIAISEHGKTTLRGVFPDFIIGSFASNDHRPSVFFYRPESKFIQWKQKHPSVSFNILIKVHEHMQTGVRKKINNILNLALAQNDAEVKSLEDELLKNYATERGFRNGMIMGNIVVLLMTIIGLLGYTTNEATRRRKELAIRRINGASLSSILRVFIIDLQYIAIPAVIIGLSGAWFVIDKWMQNFASKIPLRWEIFVGCSFFILFLVAIIAVINYVRIANGNPVEALRYE